MIRSFLTVASTLLLTACMSQAPAPAVDRNNSSQSRASTPATLPSGPGYYTVKRGDSLYRIALDNGQDHRDIAAWNNLANINAIKEGQVLRIAPPNVAEAFGAVIANPVASGPIVESRSLDAAPVAVPATIPAASANGNLKREPKVGKEPYSDEAYARLNNATEAPKTLDSKQEGKPEVKPEVVPALVPPAGPDDVVWAWPSNAKVSAPYSESGNKGLDLSGKLGDPVLAAADGKVVYAGAGLRGYGELVIIKHNATYLSAYAHNRKILVKEKDQVTRGQKIAEMGNSDADAVKLHFEIRKQGKPIDPAPYLPKR
ncbi:MAG: peptidoglycan DD-metalloendopeptidase family protein [Nitrosomonas ureae]